MRYKAITFVLLGLFLFSLVSALDVTLTSPDLDKTIQQGGYDIILIHYVIDNTGGSAGAVSIEFNPGLTNTPESKSIAFKNDSIKEGDTFLIVEVQDTENPIIYTGDINAKFGNDLLSSLTSHITVDGDLTPVGDCYLYTKNYFKSPKIQQGDTNDNIATIRVVASLGCPNLKFDDITLTSTDAMEGEPLGVSFMETSIEGKEYLFRLSANAENVQTGSYNYIYSISATGEGYENLNKDIEFIITVMSGINPITDDLPSSIPTCSLSASEFALNQTYKLICTSTNPNIEIQPVIDYDYIKGLGVTETGSTYEYSFQPKQFGNTIIRARFLFKNAPIGNEYSQEVRILASSGIVPGTSLALKFYPNLYEAKEDEPITIRAVDNESGNILTNAKIYLDGIEMLNDSLVLKSNKNYEIRASFIGYRDLVETINLNPKLINFTIGTEYNLGDSLNFTTDPEDATVTLNGSLISLPFPLNSIGTFEISVSKLGYTTSTQNITVGSHSKIIYSTPIDSIEKGGEILVEFAENETLIYVDFQADPSEAAVILVQEFTGKQVSFLTEKEGVYHVYADGEFIQQFSVIKSDGWWNFYKSPWVWIPAIIILILLFIYYGFFAPDPEDEEDN